MVHIGNPRRKHPVATKRAVRAILKAADVCALQPDRSARSLVDKGYTKNYDYAVQVMKDPPYGKWREYDPEDTVRFYALRLHEAGMIKSSPQKIIKSIGIGVIAGLVWAVPRPGAAEVDGGREIAPFQRRGEPVTVSREGDEGNTAPGNALRERGSPALLAQGDAAGQVSLGRAALDQGDHATALREFRAAAEQGNAEGQDSLGMMYSRGWGVPKSDAEALQWYRRAAEQGHAGGQVNLGAMYQNGVGVQRDTAEAVRWYRRAAEQGDPRGQFELSNMYAVGSGVPQDLAEAAKWARRAAEQGVGLAQNNLGAMYAQGRGVRRDDAEAVKWFRRAAEQGVAVAQTALAGLYAAGRGVPRDDAEAARWYRLAAEQGDANAQADLGKVYILGRGVRGSNAEAEKWLQRAAQQGHAGARRLLAEMAISPPVRFVEGAVCPSPTPLSITVLRGEAQLFRQWEEEVRRTKNRPPTEYEQCLKLFEILGYTRAPE